MRIVTVALFVVLLLKPSWVHGQEPRKILDKTLPQWREILEKDERVKYRRAAALALGAFGAAERGVVDALAKGVSEDKEAIVKITCAEVLEQMGVDAKGAVLPLGTVLANAKEDAKVREAVARSLGAMIPHTKEALPVLAQVLIDKDTDDNTRAAVAMVLKNHGDLALVVYQKILMAAKTDSYDNYTRTYLAQLLSSFENKDAEVIPVLTAMLAEPKADATMKKVAVDSLAKYGEKAKEANANLLAVFSDTKLPTLLRRSAAVTLVQTKVPCDVLWPVVEKTIKESDSGIRSQTIRLASNACAAKAELPKLLATMLNDRSVEVQLAAIQEMGELGSASKGFMKELEVIAKEGPRPSLRDAAAVALKRIRGEKIEDN